MVTLPRCWCCSPSSRRTCAPTARSRHLQQSRLHNIRHTSVAAASPRAARGPAPPEHGSTFRGTQVGQDRWQTDRACCHRRFISLNDVHKPRSGSRPENALEPTPRRSWENSAMLELIYISSLREKVRCSEGEQAPGTVSDSTARERYVPWTRPEQSPPQPTKSAGSATPSTTPSMCG